MPRVWLITGSSSGFGRAVTDEAIKLGDRVVATLRTPSDLDDLKKAIPTDQLLMVKCDVINQKEIKVAFEKGIEKFGHIDIVFNNAGYGILAEVESTPESEARHLFDVNFWGAANVMREAVNIFREVNPPGSGGWLLNMSSGAGFLGIPASGYYAASKFALEGLTESLSREIDPNWNIKITLLEPGAFRTRAQTENAAIFPAIPAYSNPSLPSQAARKQFSEPEKYIKGDVRKAAALIVKFSLIKDQPPLRWAISKEVIVGIRGKMQRTGRELDEFESWSDDVTFPDDVPD